LNRGGGSAFKGKKGRQLPRKGNEKKETEEKEPPIRKEGAAKKNPGHGGKDP